MASEMIHEAEIVDEQINKDINDSKNIVTTQDPTTIQKDKY
jgi:hypothetical protein